jgi:hypothetical protein
VTRCNVPALIAPYNRYLEEDSDAGRVDAQQVIILREMCELDAEDDALARDCIRHFQEWLSGWEARL